MIAHYNKNVTIREHLDQTKSFVKDYLKNEGLQAIVEKTVAHKDFGGIQIREEHHHS